MDEKPELRRRRPGGAAAAAASATDADATGNGKKAASTSPTRPTTAVTVPGITVVPFVFALLGILFVLVYVALLLGWRAPWQIADFVARTR